ncbi:uroporphyrinogen-III synthase [Candidatus Neptunichlamydia sp. REUL1]|uniref:uroporphyrinogen-III synthase n=1 Tax=Candidatus Neptunichlamydia sp. REUL1 TaxID=3064277 RepID=UPI00293066C8|nr:uroporphyrinogen-III synthase [Candidatus Neptunochlamydia sp. REUL1]
MKIKVGARGSKLSQRQVEEIIGELGIEYECRWEETVGDRDLVSSLGPMDKTDFFTREIDEKVLGGQYNVGIHSAKDLPDPIPKGLSLVALTRGIDSSDSLVMRDGDRLETLKRGAVIGSSSFRRNKVVKGLRPDFLCKELRGPVDMRLEMLDRGEVDALVVAEAALIRLGLTGRNRVTLPGKGAPLQGKLAVVARDGDFEMEEVFKSLDSRKKKRVLYLGTEGKKGMEHLPLIEIIPRDFQGFEIQTAMADFSEYTHVILTSKNGARIFCDCMEYYKVKLQGKKVFAVGKVTAKALEERGVKVDEVAVEETQEGVIHLLAMEDLDDAYVLLPQSSRARSALSSSLMLRRVRHQKVSIYDTKKKIPGVKPDLKSFDEIIFTSPSTVEAFSETFTAVPKGIKLTAIGAITRNILKIKLQA